MDRITFLEKQLLDRIHTLEQQGLIDHQFRICHSLKADDSLFFFLEIIPIYFSDVRTVLNDMAKIMDQPVVDFNAMFELCIKLTGSSACIGACRIKSACTRLRQAIDNKCRDLCFQGVNELKQEYHILQNEMTSIMQLEREIVTGKK